MRTLYLDCGMGAAGDMLTAALLELTDNPAAVVESLNAIGIPHVQYTAEPSAKCGIGGTHMAVLVHGHEEDDHHHDHDHHHHNDLHGIEHIVQSLAVSEQVRQDVLAVYKIIAEAESHVHGVPVTDIHFHEVGTMDAIADVTAVCVLMEMLSPEKVIASPVHVGCGQVHCAHGILPVPAPATAEILRGIPMYGGTIRGELCTPTGAALLKYFVHEFGTMPPMTTEKIGYGMGKKDFEAANCIRALLGETAGKSETVTELQCNLDDMTAEDIGFAVQQLFAAGALDVFTVPVMMKKNRPGVVLHVLCRPQDRDKLLQILFRNTTTLGVRECTQPRYTLRRETKTTQTPYGTVRQKVSEGYGVQRIKTEHDDLARIASEQGISIEEVRKLLDI